ncbi:(Fe-S)-binding protein [Synergistales bacterium]|nr:(Fe-S)-binding protein [Synergistales bacterium]
MNNLFNEIVNEIKRFLSKDPCNRMDTGEADGKGHSPFDAAERIWDEPLIGAARGDDSIFETFHEFVDAAHWLPHEALASGGFAAKPDEVSVISWVLPQTKATKDDNTKETTTPSERWARARFFGEEANTKLRLHIAEFLNKNGVDTVSPVDLKDWKRVESGRFVIFSNWSERHIAHACGLGTFALCDGLITPVGKAARFGSVVLRARLSPTSRPYARYDEYCIYKTKKLCGVCIKRCPAGAISENGHDKRKCAAYLNDMAKVYTKEHFGFATPACGFCQTGVPCASGIPGSK